MVPKIAPALNHSTPEIPLPSKTASEFSSSTLLREERINILIVDDEQKNLVVLETILDDPSYRLVRADSADQALLALVVEEFALLILDIRLPGMNGFELAQMIKERKKTAQIPIIFLTAYYLEDQHILEGYGSGAVDYLHKPVNPTILRSKVAVFADLYRKGHQVGLANRALLAEVTERRRAEERLRELNDTLELRIAERTEALRESDRRKDEFLAMLAHELRNPLAPVRNATQILYMKSPATPELKWAKEVIERQMKSFTRLIEDLMDISRIRRGKLQLKREQLNLVQIVHEAVEASRPLIQEQGHELIVTLTDHSIFLYGDSTRLTQVFLNILNNAAKFSPKGSLIELEARQSDQDVVVSVKDTGVGIPSDQLESVFEMFSQVEGSFSRAQGGLGIGLSLVKRLVEMHEGRVEVKSEGLNKGCEFLVYLPLVTISGDTLQKTIESEEVTLPTSHLHILVVDDNRDAAVSLKILLGELGYTVTMAHDGEEALQTAEKARPDVVLLDIGLPKMNGYEVAQRIRQESWGQKKVIIAMTGWGQEEDKLKSLKAGFDAHMVKPVDPFVLTDLLSKLQLSES